MAILTCDRLKSFGPCREQLNLFSAIFGRETEVNEALCVAHADKFDWNWAADHLLTAAARAEYKYVEMAAWEEYERVGAARQSSAWPEIPAHDTAPARRKYRHIKAATFGRLFHSAR